MNRVCSKFTYRVVLFKSKNYRFCVCDCLWEFFGGFWGSEFYQWETYSRIYFDTIPKKKIIFDYQLINKFNPYY